MRPDRCDSVVIPARESIFVAWGSGWAGPSCPGPFKLFPHRTDESEDPSIVGKGWGKLRPVGEGRLSCRRSRSKGIYGVDDGRILYQQRRDVPGASTSKTAGLRSARAPVSGIATTSEDVECFWCGEAGHKRRECKKKVSDGVTPGSRPGRPAGGGARAAGLSSNGSRAASSRGGTGSFTSSVSEKLQARRPRNGEPARLVVETERLSDALERHGDILREGLRESRQQGRGRASHC